MAVEYSVTLNNPLNNRLFVISDFISLEYVISVNSIGSINLLIPVTFDRTLVSQDSRLEVWRNLDGRRYLELNQQWLVRRIIYNEVQQTLLIQGVSGLELLNRRIIAYNSGTSQTSKTGLADDILVEFAKENLGSDVTDADRDWTDYINILPSPSNGTTIHKAASRRNLLKTLQEISQDSTKIGSPIFFDMEYRPEIRKFEFKTFTGQRGVDKSQGSNLLTFSSNFGNLIESELVKDFTSEATFAYAAGQGQGDSRNVQSSSDSVRINQSPFGRIEILVDSRNSDDADELTSEAEAGVRSRRPKRTLRGKTNSIEGFVYGDNWSWGDKVIINVDTETFTARIDTIGIKVDSRNESIDTIIRVED